VKVRCKNRHHVNKLKAKDVDINKDGMMQERDVNVNKNKTQRHKPIGTVIDTNQRK
jgi:hypothetical protein